MTRKQGKIIDKFRFQEGGQDVSLDLRLVQDRSHDSFYYLVDLDNPAIYATHKDPNELRKQVFDELRKKLNVSWTPMMIVHTELDLMEHHSNRGSHSTKTLEGLAGERGLKISIHCYDVGQDHYGKPIFRHRDDPVDPRTKHSIEYGEIREQFRRKDSVAVLPDTDENRAKLRLICDAFDHLSRRLRDVLGEDKILLTLANLESLPLLPAPPAENDQTVSASSDEDDDE